MTPLDTMLRAMRAPSALADERVMTKRSMSISFARRRG
jgi:hypothetical protein